MPFVDLNSLQSNGGASAAAPTPTPASVIPTDTTVSPSAALPVLPADSAAAAPVVNEVTLPELSVVPVPPVVEVPVAPVAAAPVVETATVEELPVPGTIEFDTPHSDALNPAPAVVEAPVTVPQPQADAIESAQADMAAATPVPVIPDVVTPTVEPMPTVPEVAPVEPAVMPEITTPSPVVTTPLAETPIPVVTEATLGDDTQAVDPAADGQAPAVLSFTSSPDAEDLDKPAVVKPPEIKIAEGVEVKAEQNGMREVVGPDFDQPAGATDLENITTESIDKKLANLGNMMVESPASSTEMPAVPVAELPALPSETPIPEVVTPTTVEVSQPQAMPETVTSAPTAMSADDIDLSAISSIPTGLVPPAAPVPAAPVPDPNALAEGELPSKVYNLNELLVEAINMKASDLHLTAGYRAMARVDGKLTAIKSNMMDEASIKAMVEEVIKGRNMGDAESIRDYDLSYKLPDNSARFRVNIFRQQETLAMVLRLIPTQIQSIETLKLPPVIREFTKYSSGLVLFTGPTGSGKSTTIASLLNEINLNEPRHIVTIEDPVEYVYPHGLALIDQREIFTDSASWTDALRSVLRQDPDVVLIGEMRDLETISAAIRVAETGHLVFATLHTNSASQSVDRIIDVFPEGQQTQIRTQLASVIQAIVSQRLVPITGGGRRVAAEVLVATPAVRNAIRDDKVYQIDNMIQTSAEIGMITMEKSLVGLVREGLISTEMAEEYSNKPTDVLSLLGQNH